MYLWTAVRLRQLLERAAIQAIAEARFRAAGGAAAVAVKEILESGATMEDAAEAVQALPSWSVGAVKQEIVRSEVPYDQQTRAAVLHEIDDRLKKDVAEPVDRDEPEAAEAASD